MDQSNTGPSVDSDLSESWTLLEKESSELDESTIGEGNESSRVEDASSETEINQGISNLSGSKDGAAPSESSANIQNEGTESIDSDGISIISESEEEELKLLPCNSTTVEDRPCSRSSNKYFDETDTASQCSSGVQEVMAAPSKKKYKHQPNSNLNTSLNVLLVISWAAVIGLGMGHFLGLQEECTSGNILDDKVKNESQSEDLSALLLKKLELENVALKEQFAHLQKMIEELNQKNSISPCMEESKNMDLISATDKKDDYNVDDLDRSECLLDSPNLQNKLNEIDHNRPFNDDKLTYNFQSKDDGIERNLHSNAEFPSHANEINVDLNVDSVENLIDENTDDETKTTTEEESIINKDEILQRLEQSLEDVAALFNDKLNTNKISFESSKEALSGTISVLSGLLDNLKEKVSVIKDSLGGDSLNFEKPFKAITKMEEVLQKTSEKVQKITENAFKEGKPLSLISNKVTSKLQAINKKLEEKWCQVKRNLSKQSVIWSWLDNQIFQDCTEDNKIKSDADSNKNKADSKDIFQEKQTGSKRYIDESNEEKDESSRIGKKAKEDKVDRDYKSKQNTFKNNNIGFGKTKDRYKRNDYINPHSFDTKPGKGNNKENFKPNENRERISSSDKRKPDLKRLKNGPVQNFDNGNGKNSGKYNKGLPTNKSGEWVEALFNHRAERRRDERRSDWIFARARSRSRTREREAQPSRWYLRKGEAHSKI